MKNNAFTNLYQTFLEPGVTIAATGRARKFATARRHEKVQNMRMRQAVLIFVASLLAGLDAPATAMQKTPNRPQGAAPPAQYFAALPFRETPFAPLVGVHPMSAAEAAKRNHFRFEYDRRGRPVRVSFRLGDELRDLNDTANYYFFSPLLEIEYGRDRETRRFFDRRGNRIAADGDVFEEVYTIDARGYRRALQFYDMAGAPAENSWGVARYEWNILDDGAVIEKRFDLEGDQAQLRANFPFFELRLHYGPGGWLSLMQNYGHEGALAMNALNAAQDRLEYAANGDLLAWNVLDTDGAAARGNGPDVARGIIGYDKHGYATSERYEDETGAPIESAYGWAHTKAKYDAFGNRIERANYSLDGKRLKVSVSRGYAGYRAIFDANGLYRKRIEFFGAAGEAAARRGRGYARISFVHDSQGNETAVRYEDDKGALVEREDTGFAVIKRAFDDRGRLVETRFTNAAGELVDHLRDGYAIERREYGEHGTPRATRRFTKDGVALN